MVYEATKGILKQQQKKPWLVSFTMIGTIVTAPPGMIPGARQSKTKGQEQQHTNQFKSLHSCHICVLLNNYFQWYFHWQVKWRLRPALHNWCWRWDSASFNRVFNVHQDGPEGWPRHQYSQRRMHRSHSKANEHQAMGTKVTRCSSEANMIKVICQ